MQNTSAKKRARHQDVDSDYLFGNCFRWFRWRAVCVTGPMPPALAGTVPLWWPAACEAVQGNVTWFGLLLRRSEERLIEAFFDGIRRNRF